MDGSDDRRVFEVCVVEDRVLVTLDTDFANPFNFDPRGTAELRCYACQPMLDRQTFGVNCKR
jgi:predicted nuclease of predicted toxin-antitoxin system